MFLQGDRKNDKTSDSIRFGSDVFFVFLMRAACGASGIMSEMRFIGQNVLMKTGIIGQNVLMDTALQLNKSIVSGIRRDYNSL